VVEPARHPAEPALASGTGRGHRGAGRRAQGPRGRRARCLQSLSRRAVLAQSSEALAYLAGKDRSFSPSLAA